MSKTMPPDPKCLDELVTYKEGSVVSNTLHKDGAGTITAFAFDAGEGLSAHQVAFDAFLQVFDGEAEITIEQQTHRVPAGNLIRLPANVPHAVHAPTRFKMLLTMMRAA